MILRAGGIMLEEWYVFSSPKSACIIWIWVNEGLQTNNLRQIEKHYM